MLFDTNTEFGRRVARRLAEERIIWLTTVSPEGVPHPRPVWFLWDGDTFLVYSRPNTYKLEHIARNPNVALNLDGDGLGGNIIVFTGQARLDPDAPAAHEIADYVTKYAEGFKRIQMSAKEFAETYAVAFRIRPTKVRGH